MSLIAYVDIMEFPNHTCSLFNISLYSCRISKQVQTKKKGTREKLSDEMFNKDEDTHDATVLKAPDFYFQPLV